MDQVSHSPAPPLSLRPKMGLPLQASKWLDVPLLVSTEEMSRMMEAIGHFWIFLLSGVVKQDEGEISKQSFLEYYDQYISALRDGRLCEDAQVRRVFASAWTCTTDALYAIPVRETERLIKVDKPVLQVQSHHFTYSPDEGKFLSMAFGQKTIQWGLHFSYPQLFQDAEFQVKNVREGEEFPNTRLFKNLQRWVRENTTPTPFIVQGKRVNVPIRLGKECFSWINHHPQLKANDLQVCQ